MDGKTRVYGLIGDPVEHSLSPLIHNSIAEMFKENFVYVPLPVKKENLGEAIKGAYAFHFGGLNVTVPHNSAVIPYLTDIDPLARCVGAVNTLVRTDEGFKGYNTDLPGLSHAMQKAGFTVEGENILILGAGGAARAAAFLCASQKPAKLLIANRTADKAEKIMEDIRSSDFSDGSGKQGAEEMVFKAVALTDLAKEMGSERFLAIQCTSVGLSPNDTDCVIDPDSVQGKEIFDKVYGGVDLIYKPAETVFLKEIRKRGGKTMNGLAMLLYQGVIAYELFTGRWTGQISASQEVLDALLAKMNEDN